MITNNFYPKNLNFRSNLTATEIMARDILCKLNNESSPAVEEKNEKIEVPEENKELEDILFVEQLKAEMIRQSTQPREIEEIEDIKQIPRSQAIASYISLNPPSSHHTIDVSV